MVEYTQQNLTNYEINKTKEKNKEIDDSLCIRKFAKFMLTNCSQIQNYSKFLTAISNLFIRQFKIEQCRRQKSIIWKWRVSRPADDLNVPSAHGGMRSPGLFLSWADRAFRAHAAAAGNQ